MLIAQLAEAGFEGFEEEENVLKAFIPEKEFDKLLLHEIAYKYQVSFTEEHIPEQNWNAIWETSFQPVVIDNFVTIRADFHPVTVGTRYEIIITPKMSFGTGHHATTHMMIEQMRTIDFKGKKVFDFGTGSGILAILAEKLGASKVTAIDHDDWSMANAKDNFERNNCSRIILKKANTITTVESYDIILANLEKIVILDNFSALGKQLNPKGFLVLSGLFESDEPDILSIARNYPLTLCGKRSNKYWICLVFNR